jgi:hypothetical protein
MSHSTDGLIGTTTHHNSYIKPPPMYGTPQYPSIYGGPPYYPPPPYQSSYHVVPPRSLGEPPLITMMYPVSQSSMGLPPTPGYNPSSSGSTSTSYMAYGSYTQNNPYFPFLDPPQLVNPPLGHSHVDVNFIQAFPIQQVHTFEQLNMTNLTHNKKGKNRNNDNPRQGGNDPHNHPTGGNQYQDPQGGTNNNQP